MSVSEDLLCSFELLKVRKRRNYRSEQHADPHLDVAAT